MTKLKAPPVPVITSLKEAKAMGIALAKYSPIAPDWFPEVYRGSLAFTFATGADMANKELASMWKYDLTEAEKIKIFTEYIATRLDE